jgi:phenylacetate-CoA ligase
MSLYGSLYRHMVRPLVLWKRGDLAEARYLREFTQTQWLSAEELQALQLSRLRTLLAHAYTSCPFYRRRLDAVGLHPADLRALHDLRVLPPLEKKEIQERVDDLVAQNWPRADRIANQTGGSTGTPVRFFLDRERKCSRAAATLRHNAWAGWRPGDRAAVIWGAARDRPVEGRWARWRDRLLREPLWLDAAEITEQTLQRFRTALLRWRPTVVQAYARAAVVFARYLDAIGATIPAPRGLITSAEVLEDDDRALLERVFGCPVFNRYGSREVSVLASECEQHTGLHVMAEGLYIEIETANGPAGPGETGAILVTDLLNQAMPLIRYRIGDLGSWAEGVCPCGRRLPRLDRVAGRVTDFLVGCDGRLVSGIFLATYVVAHRPTLGQVQIRQNQAGAVVYRIRPGQGFRPIEDTEYLRVATRRYLGDEARADAEIVSELPTEPSGKFLFSRSTVAAGFLSRRPEA